MRMEMAKIIERVEDKEVFECTGDVQVTGNIGKNATVIIKNGKLTVNGDVRDDAEIQMERAGGGTTVISSGNNSSFFSSLAVLFLWAVVLL